MNDCSNHTNGNFYGILLQTVYFFTWAASLAAMQQ